VVLDSESGVFDNNSGNDFVLPLLDAPTEQQVADRRRAAQAAAERERLAVPLPLQLLCLTVIIIIIILSERQTCSQMAIKHTLRSSAADPGAFMHRLQPDQASATAILASSNPLLTLMGRGRP